MRVRRTTSMAREMGNQRHDQQKKDRERLESDAPLHQLVGGAGRMALAEEIADAEQEHAEHGRQYEGNDVGYDVGEPVHPFRSSRSPRAITVAWISAAPSKMLRMRASCKTRLTGNSTA